MAVKRQLDQLRKSVRKWNAWRIQNRKVHIDLSRANLSDAYLNGAYLNGADLSGAYLDGAFLEGVHLNGANLYGTRLSYAHLSEADLTEANLSETELNRADLSEANLYGANLYGANLSEANLSEAILRGANLSEAILRGANLSEANLDGANLSEAILGKTILSDIDLRTTKGLETITHQSYSAFATSTLARSQGDIPEVFLRGVGVDDILIEHIHSLYATAIDYHTCFISYTSKDQTFAELLHANLQSKGIRCWFAPHDLRIGDKIRPRIDESIRLYDKLLLVLSEHSVKSQWVEHEVETAIGKELEGIPNVLFPIRLDNAVMESKTGWASHIKLTRNIGDFTYWQYHPYYEKAFQRLLRDLQAHEQ